MAGAELPNEKPFALVAATPQKKLEANVEFRAYGAYVDNFTSAWVELPDASRFIPPNTFRVLPLPGVTVVKAQFGAPPGVVQPAAVAGQTCFITVTEQRVQPTGGPVGATALASVATLEQFARANIPAAATAGRLIALTDYDRAAWLDTGSRIFSLTHEVIDLAAYCALDGVTDDTLGFRAAIAAAGPGVWVICPPGKTIKISGSLTLNGCHVDLQGSKIQPTAQTFSVFNVTAQLARFRLANFFLDFSTANGGVTCTNAAAIGIDFNGAIIGQVMIENGLVQFAYYGFRDTAGGFLETFRNFQVANCRVGFSKNGGTTATLIGVYATTCVQAYDFDGAVACSLIGCAMDANANGANAVAIATFRLAHGLTIDGLDVEANVVTQNGLTPLISVSNCSGFKIAGIKTSGNILATGAAGTVPFIRFDTLSFGTIQGSYWGSAFGDAATGTGTAYSVYVDGGAGANVVAFVGCQIQAVGVGAGPATVVQVLVTNTAGQDVTFVGCANFTGTVTDAGGRITYVGMGGSAITRGAVPSIPWQIFVPGVGQWYIDAGVVMHGTELRLASALRPATPALAEQTNMAIYAGTGVPNNANGANGDVYFNAAGAALTTMYQRRAGAWVGIV